MITFLLSSLLFYKATAITKTTSPSASVNAFYNIDMCASSGMTLNLPLISKAFIRTNPAGTNYANSRNCLFTINGGNTFTNYKIDFISFRTEATFDFFRIYDGNSNLLYTYNGATRPPSLLLNYRSIKFGFQSDTSTVFSGVFLNVSYFYPTRTVSVSSRRSNSPSPIVTRSRSSSSKVTNTILFSASPLHSPSSIKTSNKTSRIINTLTPPNTNSK